MSEWHVLCAAIDVLEDTQQAIQAFSVNNARKGRRSTGEKYLRTYGVLQALAVQQDAAKDLAMLSRLPICGIQLQSPTSESSGSYPLDIRRYAGKRQTAARPHTSLCRFPSPTAALS
jgi:hypothetical protein